MSNSISITLENLLKKSIPVQSAALPKVQTYCTVLDLGNVSTTAKVNLPVVTSVQSIIENPTTFEASGDTIALAQVTPVHLSAQFGFDNPTEIKGLDLTLLLSSHLTNLQLAIQSKIFALLTASNYGTAVTVSSASYVEASMQTLLNAVPGRTAIALNTPYHSKTKRDWLPFGVESTLLECSEWSGVEANVAGFVARPEAIGLCIGYPVGAPAGEVAQSKILLPIGIEVQLSRWFSRGGRAFRGSLDIVLAPQVGKSTALRLLKSA